ncbi:hypothetical protein GCM10022290_21410 [Sagittula marina]
MKARCFVRRGADEKDLQTVGIDLRPSEPFGIQAVQHLGLRSCFDHLGGEVRGEKAGTAGDGKGSNYGEKR